MIREKCGCKRGDLPYTDDIYIRFVFPYSLCHSKRSSDSRSTSSSTLRRRSLVDAKISTTSIPWSQIPISVRSARDSLVHSLSSSLGLAKRRSCSVSPSSVRSSLSHSSIENLISILISRSAISSLSNDSRRASRAPTRFS